MCLYSTTSPALTEEEEELNLLPCLVVVIIATLVFHKDHELNLFTYLMVVIITTRVSPEDHYGYVIYINGF